MADVLGIGLDLCEIARIERAITRERFLTRVYTESERARIAQSGAQTAAGYFAAKEAVAKALGTGFRGFSFDSIEVIKDELGAPKCVLHGAALARLNALGGSTVRLSITHERAMAAAVAILL